MRNLICKYIIFALFFTIITSCSEEDDLSKDIDRIGQDDEFFPENSVMDNSTVDHSTAVLGYLAQDYSYAFNKRFSNISAAVNDETVVVITPYQLVNTFKEDILKVYHRNGIIIIIDPDVESLNEWLKKQDINVKFSKERKQALVALYGNDQYLLEEFDNSENTSQKLNALVEWVNYSVSPKMSDPSVTERDIRNLIDAQSVTFTFNYSINHEEAQVIFSDPDSLKRSGTATIKYDIYPLYVFEDQNGRGDYYIVTASVKANNNTMYAGRFTNRHGGVYVRLCGFYMTELNMKSTLGESDINNSSADFPLNYTPTPKTSQGATSYSNGFSWNIGSDVALSANEKGFAGSITVKGGVSFSNSESRQIQDVDISNNSVSGIASFKYNVNNLPDMSGLSITDPPRIAVGGAEFVQSWVWRVESTKDNDATTFNLMSDVSIKYGSCHFITTAADFYQNSNEVKPGKNFSIPLIPPSRIPSGKLVIANTNTGEYITDIQIFKEGDATPIYTSTGSIASGDEFSHYIPVGKYDIVFKMGENIVATKTYKLSEAPISITRGETLTINSAFDFEEK